jgi:hypothetical protein
MKRFLIFFSLLFLVVACKDEALAPIFTFEDSIKGAYVRLVENKNDPVFDLANFGSSQYGFVVEFVDIEQGATIEEYEIFVAFRDNTPENGDFTKSAASVKSFSSADFSTNERGFVGMEVTITATEAASALGLNVNDMSASDQFRFTSAIRTNAGRVHTGENSTAAVNGDAFQGHFNFTVSLACPVSDSFMTGTYTVTYEENGESAFGGPVLQAAPFDVTLSVVSSTKRSFSAIYAEDLGFGTTVTIEFELLCDKVQTAGNLGTGLGCGGTITLGPADDFGSFDLTDDSEFLISFVEGESDGGCSFSPVRNVIKLTKK